MHDEEALIELARTMRECELAIHAKQAALNGLTTNPQWVSILTLETGVSNDCNKELEL